MLNASNLVLYLISTGILESQVACHDDQENITEEYSDNSPYQDDSIRNVTFSLPYEAMNVFFKLFRNFFINDTEKNEPNKTDEVLYIYDLYAEEELSPENNSSSEMEDYLFSEMTGFENETSKLEEAKELILNQTNTGDVNPGVRVKRRLFPDAGESGIAAIPEEPERPPLRHITDKERMLIRRINALLEKKNTNVIFNLH